MRKRQDASAASDLRNPTVITYVLEYPGTHLIKIGQAKYYQDRISQLRNGSPIESRPVCAFMGATTEHELHELSEHLWVRGEFFHFTREVREYLATAPGKMTHAEAIKVSPRVARAPDKQELAEELELLPSLETHE